MISNQIYEHHTNIYGLSVSEHPEYSYHSTLEEKSSGSHHTATKIIRSRRKLQLCMKRSVSGGRICIRIYNMYV